MSIDARNPPELAALAARLVEDARYDEAYSLSVAWLLRSPRQAQPHLATVFKTVCAGGYIPPDVQDDRNQKLIATTVAYAEHHADPAPLAALVGWLAFGPRQQIDAQADYRFANVLERIYNTSPAPSERLQPALIDALLVAREAAGDSPKNAASWAMCQLATYRDVHVSIDCLMQRGADADYIPAAGLYATPYAKAIAANRDENALAMLRYQTPTVLSLLDGDVARRPQRRKKHKELLQQTRMLKRGEVANLGAASITTRSRARPKAGL